MGKKYHFGLTEIQEFNNCLTTNKLKSFYSQLKIKRYHKFTQIKYTYNGKNMNKDSMVRAKKLKAENCVL